MAPCSLCSHGVETRNLAVRTARQVSPGLPAAAACFSDLPGQLSRTGGRKGWASAAIRVCVSCITRTWATHTPRARSWLCGAAFPWTTGLAPTAGRDARHGDHGPWEDSEGEKVDGACGGSAVGLLLPGGGGGAAAQWQVAEGCKGPRGPCPENTRGGRSYAGQLSPKQQELLQTCPGQAGPHRTGKALAKSHALKADGCSRLGAAEGP